MATTSIYCYISFPMPRMPDLTMWPSLFNDAFMIALIAFSQSISLSCLYARKYKYSIDSTQVYLSLFFIN